MTSFQYEFDNFQSLELGNMITTGAINATGMIPPFFPEHLVSLLVLCGMSVTFIPLFSSTFVFVLLLTRISLGNSMFVV
jgi:hypothetical protein